MDGFYLCEKRMIKFEVRETFIPYIGQIVFYDKLLDKYSIHHYQLEIVSDYDEFSEKFYPQVIHSK